MTVYVVQEVPKFDISKAEKYGRIQCILPPGNMSYSTDATYKKACENLKSFGPDDFLLLIGDPVAIGLCFTIAAALADGKLQLLKWDNRQLEYKVVNVNIYSQIGETNA